MPDLPRPNDPSPAQPTDQTPYSAPSGAIERIWHEVSQRHQDYLQVTAAAHTAYLNAAASLLGGAQLPPPQISSPPPALLPPPPRPVAPTTPAPEPARHAAPAPIPATRAEVNIAPAPAAPKPYTNGHAVPDVAVAAKPAAGIDPVALVRSIISEKTGYPEDMLEVDMDLEGELGVDSIKQVEILSTLRDRVPELPEIDPEKLVELRTIAAIAAMLGNVPAPSRDVSAPAAPAQAPQPQAVASVPSPSGGVSSDIVRSLIAEKTGYPTDMLEDDMDLEGELGVDSIKQVEILSALRDRYPSLPEVDPEQIAELRTIRKIADFFA